MGILAASITPSPFTVERSHSPNLVSHLRQVGWKGSKGGSRVEPTHILQLTHLSFPNSVGRFKSVRFLLVNTKVPRDTKSLVAGVGLKKQNVSGLLRASSSFLHVRVGPEDGQAAFGHSAPETCCGRSMAR